MAKLSLPLAILWLFAGPPTVDAQGPAEGSAAPNGEADDEAASEGAEAAGEAQASPAQASEPAPSFTFQTFADDPIGVRQVVLDNGLTVLLSENHERPQVFGAVVVRTGGKNDPADNTGMAHYLEHMLFKGTQSLGTTDWEAEGPLQAQLVALYEQHKQAESDAERAEVQGQIAEVVEQTYAYAIPNELDLLLEEFGAVGVNAFTSEDETVYHNSFPASQVEPWLEIYAHRFTDPVFRLFPTELEAVYEEKNISLDRFEAELYTQFMARAFPEHPYGTQSVIGEVEHLKRPSLVAMQAYFDKYYVANNMALVLAGDFDADAIMPIIAERFGGLRSGPEPEQRGGTVEPFEGRERVSLRLTPLRVSAFGFRTPEPSHPDRAALEVMRELLSNDQGSGFIDELVNDGKVLVALPLALDLADHGFDILFFAPRILGQTFKGAEKKVLAQYARVAEGEFDEQRMLALRDGLRRAEDQQWEDNEGRGLAMASSFIRYDGAGWQGYLDYRARLDAVTREDVMRVAETYFADDFLAMRSRMGFPKQPRLTKPNYPTVEPQPGAHSSFYEAIMAKPSNPPALRYVDFEADVTTTPMGEGVVLRTNPNPFNDTYTLELRFGVGTEQLRELNLAADYVERLGTASRSPAQVREQLSLLGTSTWMWSTLDETVVYLEGPEANLAEAAKLVDELVTAPVVDRKRWKNLMRERAGTAKVERKDPSTIARATTNYVMYGERSPQLRDFGPKGARKLDPEAVVEVWRSAQDYELEIRYMGQREPGEVQALLAEALSVDDPRPAGRKAAVAPVVLSRALPQRDTVYVLPRRKAIQSQLWFVIDGDPVPAAQRPSADAFNAYLGEGMTGLIFQEVREYRALAYSAWGTFIRDATPEQRGYFLGAIGCQGDKTFEAVDVMLGLLREMPAKPERMGSLRASMLRGLETSSPGFRELQGTIEAWQRRGYTEDPRRAKIEAYPGLEFADIEAFREAQIAGRPVALVVVANPKVVDFDALSRYGELVELRERDVFAR